jgi:predicted GH43/DUF377 family glycosyl hydrolase
MEFKHCLLSALPLLSAFVAAAPVTDRSIQPHENKLISRGDGPDAPYVFATFESKNEQKKNEETYLDIWTSDDGINWNDYARHTYKPVNGLIRDPSIMKRNGKWWVCHTTGWKGSNFAIISSDDLKTWNLENTVNVMGDQNVESVWAPVSIFIQNSNLACHSLQR